MKFGMPTLIEFNSVEENINLCKELGLDFVELNMNMSYCLPSNNDIENINKLTHDNNIELTMHFPEEIDFGTPFDIMKVANIKLFEELCVYGSKLNVKKINVHLLPGTVITLPHKKMFAYEKNCGLFFNNLTHSFKEIVDIANKLNVEICIENTSVPEFLRNAFEILTNIDHLAFTYDIGHDAKANYYVESIYKKLGKKVTHMHFHDYDGKTDHQALFKGNINLLEKLNMAKANNMTVVIEVKSKEALKQSAEELKIRNLI
ncbi:MAG: endonuclease [Haloplasmataceae bacterium]|jgi:sugar phosphate isomerase/epimerase|nr:endonuclease [Haloplasmataceae bacterium]